MKSNKGQAPIGARIDEFAFVLLAGLVLILIMALTWTQQTTDVEVLPATIGVKASPGSPKIFAMTFNGTMPNVSLVVTGQVAGWISFLENNFEVMGLKTIDAQVTVPVGTNDGSYTGLIEVYYASRKKIVSVTIDVSKAAVAGVPRDIRLGDFSVSYLLGPEAVATAGNKEVSKGYFSEYKFNLVHEAIADDKFSAITAGTVYLLVEDTNNAGNLIVEFNGVEMHNKKASVGEVSVTIPRDQIKKSNVVTVRAGSPGWTFWMNTVYSIKTARFSIDYQKSVSPEKTFTLADEDVLNFKFGKLHFLLGDSKPTSDMLIKINGYQIYKGTPPKTFDVNFGSEVGPSIGTNIIYFSVDREASYSLQDVVLTIVRRG